MLPVFRALLSVSDKRGLVELARDLTGRGIEVVSTGGTRRHLEAAGIPVTGVSAVTGFPEILDGRVKTLHPRIHGGILADRSKTAHLAALAEHDIARIDLVVVNLYPFERTAARDGASEAEVVEMALYQQIYTSLLSSYEGVRLARLCSTPNVVQIEQAHVPGTPIQPQPLRSAMIGGIIGLLFVGGLAFLIEYLDDTLKTPEDVTRYLNIPVIG